MAKSVLHVFVLRCRVCKQITSLKDPKIELQDADKYDSCFPKYVRVVKAYNLSASREVNTSQTLKASQSFKKKQRPLVGKLSKDIRQRCCPKSLDQSFSGRFVLACSCQTFFFFWGGGLLMNSPHGNKKSSRH